MFKLMRCKTICSFVVVIPFISILPVMADQAFSMDDINASLQMEYQSQLVLQPTTNPKKNTVKIKPKKAQLKPKMQTRVAPSRTAKKPQKFPVRQPVKKAPVVPDAEELFEAASHGNVNLIARLIRQGLNVNTANQERETALHMAVANGRYSAVIYLINHGANIHARTINNWLPIHHAARFRKANIANYLVKKGASPHARTSHGLSAIDMARTLRDPQLLRILGAKVK